MDSSPQMDMCYYNISGMDVFKMGTASAISSPQELHQVCRIKLLNNHPLRYNLQSNEIYEMSHNQGSQWSAEDRLGLANQAKF